MKLNLCQWKNALYWWIRYSEPLISLKQKLMRNGQLWPKDGFLK